MKEKRKMDNNKIVFGSNLSGGSLYSTEEASDDSLNNGTVTDISHDGYTDNDVVREAPEDAGIDPNEIELRDDHVSPNIIRDISIRQLNFGYNVTIGCHTFAIETYKTVTNLLAQYMANPSAVEKTWYTNTFVLKRNPTI